jgi:hypothetical protein
VAFRSLLRLVSLIPHAFSALAHGSAAFIRAFPLLDNQERELREVADRMGCEIVMGL